MTPSLEFALSQGAGLTVWLLIPLLVGASLCAGAASALAGTVGIADQTAASVARALGTVLVLLALGGAGWHGLETYAGELWGGIHEVDSPSGAE